VDDPARVRGGERARDLHRDADGLLDREWARINPRAKRLSFHEFHDDEGPAAELTEVMHHQDMRVVERRGCPCFRPEPPQPFGIVGDACGEQLQRDRTIEFSVVRLVHFAHPARADERQELETGNLVPVERRANWLSAGQHGRVLQEPAREFVRGEQFLDVLTQLWLRRARHGEIGAPV
jgi:hypothetical protein